MADHDAEMAQLVGTLGEAGRVEVHTDDEGQEVSRLAAEGVRVGISPQWAMTLIPTPC